ncbi:NACHT domain-containing protein [Ancylomarina sp. YFZ004]
MAKDKQNLPQRNITQTGDKSVYAENINNLHIHNHPQKSIQDLNSNLLYASVALSSYNNEFGNKVHITRKETDDLFDWINKDLEENETPIAILAGNAGYGKSVVLRDLFDKLSVADIPVLGIKADRLKVNKISELAGELQLDGNINDVFKTLCNNNRRTVLLVDQIDALSQSLSSNRDPINTYDSLISRLSLIPNIRIVISTRIYDLEYDPLLQEYRKNKIFRMSGLSESEVINVLNSLQIEVGNISNNLKKFLQVPLHLKLFCQIGNPNDFKGSLNLQALYDSLWEDYILVKPEQEKINSEKCQELITSLASEMYQEQRIFSYRKQYLRKFKKELDYLSHQELIINNDNNKIQFAHQSFFDYAYARTFIEQNLSISEEINKQHQGLFIRSKIKQVFAYLREFNPEIYINELKIILFNGSTRFHIKLLLINDLGFYAEPLAEEKVFLKESLVHDQTLFRIFLESCFSINWFSYINGHIGLSHYYTENNEEFINTIYSLCHRLIKINPIPIVDFLKSIPDSFENKNLVIGRTLTSLESNDISHGVELFNSTKQNWNEFEYYHFLDLAMNDYPELVMSELQKKLESHLKNNKIQNDEYVPGGYDSEKLYEDLYKKHPDLAISFFIDAITQIAFHSKYTFLDDNSKLHKSNAYFRYTPFKEEHYKTHEKIYDYVIEYLGGNSYDCVQELVSPLVNSPYVILINLALSAIIKYPLNFMVTIKQWFFSQGFFINYLDGDQLHEYYILELLKVSYPLFSFEEQESLNKLILNAIPKREKTTRWQTKGVSKYGYTRIGSNSYRLISSIPEGYRQKSNSLKRTYQEQFRKYGVLENEVPKGVQACIVGSPLADHSYQRMSLKDWKNSFKTYIDDFNKDWNKGSKLEHCRSFESHVSKDPEKFIPLIEDILNDRSIIPDYFVYGLNGLKNAKYDPLYIGKLLINFIKSRRNDLDSMCLQSLIWTTQYLIAEGKLYPGIINFLKDLALNYEDGKMLNDDPVNDGINRVRGGAAYTLVEAYKLKQFEEDIFSTLEQVADTAAVHTRAAIIYKQALLNNLDADRNLDLFLKLMHDYHPLLLKITLHDLHPLIYLISVDFQKLIPFFKKAITIKESYVPISHALLIAWFRNYLGSEELLTEILNKSIEAKKTVMKICFNAIKEGSFKEKSWRLIKQYINETDKELGKTYEFGFVQLKKANTDPNINFINEYLKSPISQYRKRNFYNYLLSLTKSYPEQCIQWSLNNNYLPPLNIQERAIQNEPLQVVIQAYNAIRDFSKKDPILEKAMDAFDEMLKIKEYRGTAIDVLQQLDD